MPIIYRGANVSTRYMWKLNQFVKISSLRQICLLERKKFFPAAFSSKAKPLPFANDFSRFSTTYIISFLCTRQNNKPFTWQSILNIMISFVLLNTGWGKVIIIGIFFRPCPAKRCYNYSFPSFKILFYYLYLFIILLLFLILRAHFLRYCSYGKVRIINPPV